MRPLLFLATLTLICLVAGCSEDPAGRVPPTPPPAPPPPQRPVAPEVNRRLLELVRGHQVPAHMEGDWVAFTGTPFRMSAGIDPEDGAPDKGSAIVQVDFRALLPDGRIIVQQVVGWGDDREQAIASAEASFLLGSFHAFLGAFVDPAEEHVISEERTIGGRKRIVTSGGVLAKTLDKSGMPEHGGWRSRFLEELDRSDLPPGTHWVDLYHGYAGDQEQLQIELDNERWTEMEQKMRDAPWPRVGVYTSVRQFLIIQDPDDPTRPKPRPKPQSRPVATTRPGNTGQ